SRLLVGLGLRKSIWVVRTGSRKDETIVLEGSPIRIGSAGTNNLRLVDQTVSRQHALVEAVAEGFLIRDLDSRNGVFLDGRRVREAYLIPGMTVQLGSVVL